MWFGQSSGLRKIGLALGLLLGAAGTAEAAPGDHLRAGDAVITPRLQLGFLYRSNAFRSETNPQGTGGLRVAPGLGVGLETPQVTFGFDGEYVLSKFLFLGNPENVGRDQINAQIANLDRFNSFNVEANLKALKDRQVSLRLGDTVLLQNNPNDSVPESDDPYATQLRNNLTGGLIIRPGPALSVDVGGKYNYGVFFVPSSLDQRDPFNRRHAYGPTLDVKYNFLPRTAYVFDGAFTWNSWADQNPDLGGIAIPKPNSRHLQMRTGIQGRITERLRVVGKVGFGFAWYDDGVNLTPLNGLLVAVQGDYRVTEKHDVTLGYRKNFVDSFFTNAAAHNSLYARWKGAYGPRVTSNLQYALRFENYTGGIERNDIVNQLNLGFDIKAQEWLSTGLSGGWLGRISTDPQVEYNDVRVQLGATFTY